MKEKGKGKKFPTRKNLLRLPAGIKVIISLSMLRAALELITAENEAHYSQSKNPKNYATTNLPHKSPPNAVGTIESAITDTARVKHTCTDQAEPSTSSGITHRSTLPKCSTQNSCSTTCELQSQDKCCCCCYRSSRKARCRKSLPMAISKPISHWFGDIFLTDESKAKLLKEEIKQIRINQELISSNIETRCTDILSYINASSDNTQNSQQPEEEGNRALESDRNENNQPPAPHGNHEQNENAPAGPTPGHHNEELPNSTVHLNTPDHTSNSTSLRSHINVNSLFGSDDDDDDEEDNQNSHVVELAQTAHIVLPTRPPLNNTTALNHNNVSIDTEHFSMSRNTSRPGSRHPRRGYSASYSRIPASPVEDPETGIMDLSQRNTSPRNNNNTNPIYPPFETSSTHEAYENMWLTARPPVINATPEINQLIRQAVDADTQSGVQFEPDTSPAFPHLPSLTSDSETPASRRPISEEITESGKVSNCTQTFSTSVVSTQTETPSDTESDNSSTSSILPPFPQVYYKRKKGK